MNHNPQLMTAPGTIDHGARADAPSPMQDPRLEPGFVAAWFPRVQGGDPPPVGSRLGNDPLILEFLTAYYHINAASVRLRQCREAHAGEKEAREGERAALQDVDRALTRRDALEDRHAPHGVIAEPVMHDGIALDLRFTFGNVNALGQLRSHPIVFSGAIKVRLPAGAQGRMLTLADPSRSQIPISPES